MGEWERRLKMTAGETLHLVQEHPESVPYATLMLEQLYESLQAQINFPDRDKNYGRDTNSVPQREEIKMEATFNIKQGDRVVAMSDADLRHNFGFNPFTEKPSEGRHIERSRRHDMSKRDRFVDNLIDFSVSNLDFLVKAAIVGGVAYLVLWAGGRMLGWTKVN